MGEPLMEMPPKAWSTLPTGASARSLDTLEVFFKLLADSGASIQREHWAISLALRLQFPAEITDPGSYVRQTWLLLRKLHPNLGAVGEKSIQSMTVPPLDAEEWLSESFVSHKPRDGDGDPILDSTALFSAFRPTPTATCHWLPDTQEVHIRSSHWRIDGVGIMMLGHSFMTALGSVLRVGITTDLDAYPRVAAHGCLTPSLDDIANSYTDEGTTPQSHRAAADELVAEFIKGVPSIALPNRPGSDTVLPGASAREATMFDKVTTAAILAACKSRGISIASAVHAALILVTATHPQHHMAKSYASFFPTDLRRYLGSPWSGVDYAVGMFCSGLPVCITGVDTKTFDEIAAELHSVYSRDLSRACVDEKGQVVGMHQLVAPYVRRTTKLFTSTPPPELPPVQNPDLSSLGLVERYIQREYSFGEASQDKVGVVGFWSGTEMLVRSLQCHVWTFRDQLTLQGCYNESFYDSNSVKDTLARIKSTLLFGLSL